MYAAHNSLINLDADVHRDLRLQQSEFFFPKYVETLKERVGKKIDDLLDNMERQGPEVDFAKMFSTELPMFTLCEMLVSTRKIGPISSSGCTTSSSPPVPDSPVPNVYG